MGGWPHAREHVGGTNWTQPVIKKWLLAAVVIMWSGFQLAFPEGSRMSLLRNLALVQAGEQSVKVSGTRALGSGG